MDPTKKELYTAKRSSGLNIINPVVNDIIQKLRSDSDSTNWILMKVIDNNISIHAYGENGLQGFSDNLNDEDVYYGVIRCLVDSKVKFYHICVVGNDVNAMKKGKSSLYKQAIFSLAEAHGELTFAGGLAEYSSDLLIQSISNLAKSSNIII